MPEGDTHRQLVEHLSNSVKLRRGGMLCVYIDGVRPFLGKGPPPALGDIRPDIYAIDEVTKHIIIGEAKSASDIDNDHTEKQLTGYFEHLASRPSGELVIAVPFCSAGTAHRLCLSTRNKLGLKHISFEISGWFLGRKPFSQVWYG